MAERSDAGTSVPDDGFHPAAREAFRSVLRATGFERCEDANRIERWSGVVSIPFKDTGTSEPRPVEHRVRVEISPGFPFDKPRAYWLDGGERTESRHLAPITNGELCLYPDTYRPDTQRGWAPWRTGEEFLERLRAGFTKMYQREWDATDRPPDLHLAFPSGGGLHPMLLIDDSWSPPTGGRSGRFGVWREKEDVAFAGHPVGDTALVPTDHGDSRVLWIFSLGKVLRTAVGAWFRLKREPSPRKTVGGLLAEIDRATGNERGWALAECCRLLGSYQSGNKRPWLALGYPDASVPGGEAWLFLELLPASKVKAIRWTKQDSVVTAQLRASETVSVSRHALMRRTGPLAQTVAGRRVVIFGVGALGGGVALLLARSGVERLRLIDSDRMRPGNAVRHVAGMNYTGRQKTLAVSLDIALHAPDTQVEPERATWDPVRLRTLVADADVVIDTTVNQPFSLLLNEICVHAHRPFVHAETMRRGAIGRIRVVRPGRDACLTCYEAHKQSKVYPVVPPGEYEEFFEDGCGVPTVEAPAVDVEATANWTARIALWLLRDVLGPRNHCLVVNDEVPGLTGKLGMVGIHWLVFGPVACNTCGGCDAYVAEQSEAETG